MFHTVSYFLKDTVNISQQQHTIHCGGNDNFLYFLYHENQLLHLNMNNEISKIYIGTWWIDSFTLRKKLQQRQHLHVEFIWSYSLINPWVFTKIFSHSLNNLPIKDKNREVKDCSFCKAKNSPWSQERKKLMCRRLGRYIEIRWTWKLLLTFYLYRAANHYQTTILFNKFFFAIPWYFIARNSHLPSVCMTNKPLNLESLHCSNKIYCVRLKVNGFIIFI